MPLTLTPPSSFNFIRAPILAVLIWSSCRVPLAIVPHHIHAYSCQSYTIFFASPFFLTSPLDSLGLVSLITITIKPMILVSQYFITHASIITVMLLSLSHSPFITLTITAHAYSYGRPLSHLYFQTLTTHTTPLLRSTY